MTCAAAWRFASPSPGHGKGVRDGSGEGEDEDGDEGFRRTPRVVEITGWMEGCRQRWFAAEDLQYGTHLIPKKTTYNVELGSRVLDWLRKVLTVAASGTC